MIPTPKVEIRFNGVTWTDVSAYVKLAAGMTITRGRDDESGDAINPGTFSFTLENNDGRFSPGLTTSPHYPYVVKGVAVRVSMYVNGGYRRRAYGTVRSWSVSWLGGSAESCVCYVTCADTLGSLPSYTYRQPVDEAVRETNSILYHWPIRGDADPCPPLEGAATLTSNGGTGLGLGGLLPMDEGTDGHALFEASAGKLKLTTSPLTTPSTWAASLVILTRPTADCEIMTLGCTAVASTFNMGPTITWTAADGFSFSSYAWSTGPLTADVFPVQVAFVGRSTSSTVSVATSGPDTYTTSGLPKTGRLTKITINPTLSGGSKWQAGHLAVTGSGSWPNSNEMLAKRVPGWDPIGILARWAGVASISGAPNEGAYPLLEGRDSADAISALVTGMGARLVDDLDGGLDWVAFTPDTTPVALPAGEVDPSLTWDTSDVGWCTSATVTRYDSSTYTANNGGDEPRSVTLEGVHDAWPQDRSYADWLVNTASTDPRLSSASFELLSLPEATAQTLCGITVGSRVELSSLPSQVPAGTHTEIVEGIEDTISDTEWMLTFKFSPDVYSRLFILDDATAGVLDSAYILAP